tara:strand:+ start:1548 stop:1763 length:216 start_codon:yes stop_codon:yes gene_type:complete
MTYPQTALTLEDLPILIKNKDQWISFQQYKEEVLKLSGTGKVGSSTPNPTLSVLDASLELKHYLKNGWVIN